MFYKTILYSGLPHKGGYTARECPCGISFIAIKLNIFKKAKIYAEHKKQVSLIIFNIYRYLTLDRRIYFTK